MRWKIRIAVIGCWLSAIVLTAYAQNDSTFNRSVTVERDFQPIIQAAGKISVKPSIEQTTIEPAPVEYSDYTADVTPGSTFHSLLSQPTRFEPGKVYHGYIRGALGHPNTLFDFGYHLDDGKKSILDAFAHHHAEWGLATLSKTKLGFNFTHTFNTCNLYFGVNGGNIYYRKYGHFYDYSTSHGMWEKNKVAYSNTRPLTEYDKTSLWTAEVFVGLQSNAKQDFQYKVQTGYMLFSKPGAVSEHQVRTLFDFDWHRAEHHAGANIYVQNNILQLQGKLDAAIPDSLYSNRHNIRVEPYYAYEGRRINLHVGVNFDLNIGKGHHHLSGIETLSFAPSPHINMEAQIAKKWLTVYADVTGDLGMGSLQSYMEENRYSFIHAGIIHPCSPYTPVDAEAGFRIRPHRDLLFEIHGGYAYMMDEDYMIATADTTSLLAPLNIQLPVGEFIHRHTDYQRGKIGGQINYHFRDYVNIHLNGDYFIWKGDSAVYDRPNWKIDLRIDGKIDEHWSLYSDNHLLGSRLALATDGTHELKPVIDLNLGLQYDMWVGKEAKEDKVKVNAKGEQMMRPATRPNLTFFFQLNNWLHRKNELFYGYRSQGINFLLGATYRF